MVHSIELIFDADTETAVRRIWTDLAAAEVPSQAPAVRPHVTRVVAQRIAGRSDITGRFIGLRRWDGNARTEYLL